VKANAGIAIVSLLVLVIAPFIFSKGFALSLLCQMGILIVFALSYNMLLGQTGLLSFGHAVYYGLGALFTIHALNLAKGGLAIPVPLVPLVGGAAGLAFGLLFGFVTTRRAGTTFSMISLGIGELVAACSLMFPVFFGGEAGISGNRAVGQPVMGITFGPQIQVYYLIAAWTFACVAAMFALTRTPLGRMANAVRDNPERAQFVGYDPQWVRFLMVALSGFFAGIAGGLAALNYEIVSAESLSATTSGLVLLATFLGGVSLFFGPIIGAIVVTLMQTVLAGITHAWPFYFGLLFLATVLFVPGGIASVVMMHKRLWESRLLGLVAPVYARMAIPVLLVALAVVLLIEMSYRASENAAAFSPLGFALEPRSPGAWLGLATFLVASGWLARWQWRREGTRWSEVSARLAGGKR
jgi:branched-chain amino acid transport system permease protein